MVKIFKSVESVPGPFSPLLNFRGKDAEIECPPLDVCVGQPRQKTPKKKKYGCHSEAPLASGGEESGDGKSLPYCNQYPSPEDE